MGKSLIKSILIFGKTPPPIGGVTRSVENMINALNVRNIKFNLFSIATLISIQRYDIAHIHYIKRWKILIAILLGKILARKNILTYHGSDFYPDKAWIDRLLFILLDGVIVLNKQVQDRCGKLNPEKTVLFTPIFQEGVLNNNLDEMIFFDIQKDKNYILLYAYDKVFFENKEVYGCSFIFSLLDNLPKNCKLVFVDPNGGYKEDIKKINKKIIYIDKVIDFIKILSSINIYVRPTNFDGSSVSILEALSCNVPVLASDVVDRGAGVETYKNNDEKDFIDKLRDILNNQQALKKRHLTSVHDFEIFCTQLLRGK